MTCHPTDQPSGSRRSAASRHVPTQGPSARNAAKTAVTQVEAPKQDAGLENRNMKDSFFGTEHGQGQEAVRFFTESKVVIQRWF